MARSERRPNIADADEMIEVSLDAGRALKALAAGAATGPQQRLAYGFILHALAGVDRSSFVPEDDGGLTMAWREGRRFVGRHMRRIVETPIPDTEKEPERERRQTTATQMVERGR